MRNIGIFGLLFSLFFIISSCDSLPVSKPQHQDKMQSPKSYRIVGYVTPKALKTAQVDATKLTHINFAFANVIDGKVVEGRASDSLHYAQLRALKTQNPNLKLLFSAGGWGWSGGFSDAVVSDSSREIFAESAVSFMRKHQLDGVDLDWEYPGLRGNDNVHRPEDKQNFTLILKRIREKLDSLAIADGQPEGSYLLTIATGAFQSYLDHTEMDVAHKYLDFINIMTYDYRTGGSKTAGHHANLFLSDSDPNKYPRSTQSAVNEHIAAGIPPEKLVVGAAFYGRGWSGVEKGNQGLHGVVKGTGSSYAYSELAANYIDKNGYTRHWDESAKAPYLWNDSTATLISYDDEMSLMHKAKYVQENGLGGIMFWEYSHDPEKKLLNQIYKTLEIK